MTAPDERAPTPRAHRIRLALPPERPTESAARCPMWHLATRSRCSGWLHFPWNPQGRTVARCSVCTYRADLSARAWAGRAAAA